MSKPAVPTELQIQEIHVSSHATRLVTVLVLILTSTFGVAAQPPTDVYLTELTLFDGVYFLGELANVSDRPDAYDNQPAFTPDSRSVLFTAWYDDGNDGQTEIHRHHLSSGRTVRVTRTPVASEYSATPIPGDRAFSAIRVEADSTQRLWRYTMQGMDAEPVLADVAPVGYHAWADDADTLLLFVLGDPPTLQMAGVESRSADVLAENPGRSLHRIPEGSAFSFVDQRPDGQNWISRVDVGTGQITPIVRAVDDGVDHTWSPDGILLMASGARLFQYNPEVDEDWREIADYSDTGLTFSRLDVSPDGARLAIVGLAAEPEGD